MFFVLFLNNLLSDMQSTFNEDITSVYDLTVVLLYIVKIKTSYDDLNKKKNLVFLKILQQSQKIILPIRIWMCWIFYLNILIIPTLKPSFIIRFLSRIIHYLRINEKKNVSKTFSNAFLDENSPTFAPRNIARIPIVSGHNFLPIEGGVFFTHMIFINVILE